jgi:NADH-quinone oxidoreductase subunit A
LASVAADYLPILLFLAVALGLSTAFVVLPMIVSRFTGRTSRTRRSSANMSAASRLRGQPRQFDVRFYLVAILFIVFDLEVAFLFPWAVRSTAPAGRAGWQ